MHIGAGTSLNLSTPGVAITGSSQTATGLLPAIAWGGSKPPRIFGNRAGNKGGGVFLDSNNHAAVVGVLLNMVSGNTAKYDPDLSVALQHIEVLGPRLVSISSRLNRTSGTLNVTVKLTGPFGVTCGGWRVQVSDECWQAGGAEAAATARGCCWCHMMLKAASCKPCLLLMLMPPAHASCPCRRPRWSVSLVCWQPPRPTCTVWPC